MTGRGTGKAKAPISSHPVFPAIVALWFAALLGLGSLVLPVVLLERMVALTGLGEMFSAAQPPLGVTARILIALAAAAIGAIAGLALARKVAAAQAPERSGREARAPRTSAKRPISASEELGISRLDVAPDPDEAERPAPIPGRKRALAVSNEATLSDYFEHAPLPGDFGHAEPAPAVDELDLGAFAEQADVQEVAEPLGSAPPLPPQIEPAGDAREPAFEAPLAAHAPEPEPEPEPASVDAHEEPIFEEPPMPTPPSPDALSAAAAQPFARPTNDPAGAEPANDQPSAPSNGDLAARPLGELGMAELVARFALSLQRKAEAEDGPIELPRLRVEPAAPEGRETAPSALDRFDPVDEPVLEDEPEAPFETEAPVAPEAHPPLPPTMPAPAVPAALQPIAFDEEDESIDVEPLGRLSLSLDPQARPFARPASEAFHAPPSADDDDEQPDASDADAGEADDEDAGYSSLLAMKRPLPAGREFVRIDEEDSAEALEPVVVFPGQQRPAAPASDGPAREPVAQNSPAGQEFRPFDGPAGGQRAARPDFTNPAQPSAAPARRPDAGDTERALRTALEKLQKMSGAA